MLLANQKYFGCAEANLTVVVKIKEIAADANGLRTSVGRALLAKAETRGQAMVFTKM
jgi:hypothetical protein